MTDSYHFESVPKFRVGGVYRDGFGTLYRLVESSDSACAFAQRDNGKGGWLESVNLHRLADGMFARIADPDGKYHLIPGELIERDGQWVAADAPIVFPSGAAVLTSGDKIVGRVETQSGALIGITVTVAGGSGYSKPAEPYRAPLPHFNQRTEFDAFPDYVVFHEFEPVAPLYDSPTTDSAYPAIAGLLRG